MEVDENGRLRTEGQYFSSLGYDPLGNCRLGSLGANLHPRSSGGEYLLHSRYSNGGWGNFSESGDPFTGLAADGNGDGRGDVDLRQYDLNGKPSQLNADLFPKSTRFNIMAFGEYTIAGEANLTPYFEANYAFLEVAANSGEGQLFPEVPALNPSIYATRTNHKALTVGWPWGLTSITHRLPPTLLLHMG